MNRIPVPHVEILDKSTKEVSVIPARDFCTPYETQDDFVKNTELKPKTYTSAYQMLLNLLGGSIYQNVHHAIRLEGVKHEWDW